MLWKRLALWDPWLLMVAAFLMRAAFLDRVAVEHFDEGVYSSGYFAEHLGYRYPDEHLYAPPLLPTVLRSILFFTSGDQHAVTWVNVVAGSLLAGAVWLLAKEWFGRESALAAGIFVVTSEFAILYSRTLLTDTLLSLWLVLGVWSGWRAVVQGELRWILIAGGLAALAWWTKYNGWLTLAITGSGTLAWVMFERPNWKESTAALVRWIGTAAVAVILWLPVLWLLQPYGGYAAVAANHAGYFSGIGGWWETAVRQVQATGYIEGLTVLIGFAVLLVIALTAYGGWRRRNWLWGGLIPLAAVGGCVGFGFGTLLVFVVSLLSLGEFYWSTSRRDDSPDQKGGVPLSAAAIDRRCRRLALWMAAAWFVGLMLAIPLYRPYPRLMLPWLMIAFCCTGRGLVCRFRAFADQYRPGHSDRPGIRWPLRIVGLTLFVLPLLIGLVYRIEASPRFIPWQVRTGLRDAAALVLRDLPDALAPLARSVFVEADCVLYVLGEPGLYYHLAAAQGTRRVKHVAQPASNLGMLRPGSTAAGLPAFLVTGLHAHRDHPELLEAPPPQLELVGEYPYRASDLVLMDEWPPSRLEQHRQQVIRFWRIDVDRHP